MRLFKCIDGDTYTQSDPLVRDFIHHGCHVGNGEIFLMGILALVTVCGIIATLISIFTLIPMLIYEECKNVTLGWTWKNIKKSYKFIVVSIWKVKKTILIVTSSILGAITFIWLIGYNVSLI